MQGASSQIEWHMKVKTEISICTGLMLNDHSNPYIESTTVLSDNCIIILGPRRKHAVLGQRRSRLLLCRAPVAHISTFGIYSSHGSRENVGTEKPTDRPTNRTTTNRTTDHVPTNRPNTITLRCACVREG